MSAHVRPTGEVWDAERLSRRRAVEALRSGVPNADAVIALGSGQSDVEDQFAELLERVAGPRAGGDRGGAGERGHASERASLLLGAGFGEGKSHLLTHLGHLATSAGFVVSTVVISKETPLHDPAKVLRATVASAVAPDGSRDVVKEAADALDPDNSAYADLLRWLRGPGRDLNERFEATLLLHQRLGAEAFGGDEEFIDTIVRFWSGDPLPVPDLRRQLKAIGEAKTFTFSPVKVRDLARQRLRFLPRLLHAAGRPGWVILLDEVELIGRYSLLQRGRAYAELARWLDGETGDTGDPVVVVGAMTDDFEAAVLHGKSDLEVLPGRLRDKQTDEYAEMATLAETGMRHIERDLVHLVPPDAVELDRAYTTLRTLHGDAYGWQPPHVPGLERLGATRMRQYVRAWINEWDLVRMDPAYQPSTEVVELASDYDELAEDDDAGT
ncbi:BREX system ATP-binding domain-containing protein [Lapillicoccus sp.]|uniref:BREX system ATP-binding domain-containing protein n=1 Tax=Lapillicoccus sp. TaxID=1909287 RepID=UPI0025F4B479|nr:BREX system ATP-binding domain-containing protein [Lapillicoccus sp.]